MKFNQLYPSKYLKSSDVVTPLTLTIKTVRQEEVGGEDDEDKIKPVLHFTDNEKGMVLNRTNGAFIESMYGDETDYWHGKRITLYSTKVPFGGRIVDAIRVREPKGEPVPTRQPESVPSNGNPVLTAETEWTGKVIVNSREANGKQKDGTPWSGWFFKLKSGEEVGTFDKLVAQLAMGFITKEGNESPVRMTVTPGSKPGTIKLLSIEDDSDVPF